LRPLRLGEEKKKKEEDRNHRAKINIMACPLLWAAIKSTKKYKGAKM